MPRRSRSAVATTATTTTASIISDLHRGVGMTTLLLLALLLACASPCLATDYTIQAILPISGTSGARYQQWASAARIAAAQVSASWAPNDALFVDVIDSKGNAIYAIQAAIDAGRNASVHAVIGMGSDVTTTNHAAVVLAHDSVPLVAPNCEDNVVNTQGLGLYSMTPLSGFRLNMLEALFTRYSWHKIGVVFIHTDEGESVRDQINAIPGVSATNLGMDPAGTDFTDILDKIYRLSINVVVVYNPDPVTAGLLFDQAVSMQLLVPGRAWIFIEEASGSASTLPSFPQGTLVVDEVDANHTSLNQFTAMLRMQDEVEYPSTGPGCTLEASTIQAYDSVMVIASAIENAKSGGVNPVTRKALNDSIASISVRGWSGDISFDPSSGFRVVGNSEVFFAPSSSSSSSSVPSSSPSSSSSSFSAPLNLSMTYDDAILAIVEEPLFPGLTYDVPMDDVDIIPIAIMLDFSGGNSTPFDTAALRVAMEYAIFRLNNVSGLLPANKKVCAILLDDQTRPTTAVQNSINLPNLGIAGVVGGMSSSISIVVQDVVSAWNIPQISPGATAPQLSDKETYPTFARVVSSATVEGDIVIDLCAKYNWTEISILSTLDAYGSAIAQEVLTKASANGINILDHTVIDPLKDEYDAPLQRLADVQPRILVMLVGIESIANVVRSMERLNLKPLATISTDSILLTNVTDYALQLDVDTSWFDGWVIMGQPGGEGVLYDNFKQELQNLDPIAWPGVYTIAASSPLIISCFDACTVFADAIRRCVEEGVSFSPSSPSSPSSASAPSSSSSTIPCDPRNGTQMFQKILEIKTTLLTGPFELNDQGDRDGVFEIRNVRDGHIQKSVGRWSAEERLVMYQEVVWPDGSTTPPLAVLPRVQTWLKWSSGAGVALSVVAGVGILVSLLMLVVIYQQRNSPVIVSATWQFLILMLAGCILGFGSVWVWIGKPVPYLCALRIWIPPLAFVIIISPLLAKTWRLLRIFSLNTMKVEPIPLSTLIIIVSGLLTVQIIICIFWISIGTIQVDIVPDKHDTKLAYVVCKYNNANKIASYVTYGYNGVLLLIGCYLSFRVRKLPKDFNESRWIARTIYNTFLFAGLIIILGYALSSFITTVLILICVCTLAICLGSIALIMSPKLWELYVHPERRSSSSGRSQDSTRLTTRRGGSSYRSGSLTSIHSKKDGSKNGSSDRDSKTMESTRGPTDYSRPPGTPSTVSGKSRTPTSSPQAARRASARPQEAANANRASKQRESSSSSSSASYEEENQHSPSSNSSSSSEPKEEV